jgi:hypothetical protein
MSARKLPLVRNASAKEESHFHWLVKESFTPMFETTLATKLKKTARSLRKRLFS